MSFFFDIGELKHTSGECPVDGTPIVYTTFSASSLDIALSPDWAPLVLKVCPSCLACSAEQDFFSRTARQESGDTISGLLRSPYSSLRKDFVMSLGMRARLVEKCFLEFNGDDIRVLLDDRAAGFSLGLLRFLTCVAPALPETGAFKIVEHMKSVLLAGENPLLFLSRLTGSINEKSIIHETPAARLFEMGCGFDDLSQAFVYGPLASSFDDALIEKLRASHAGRIGVYAKIIMLQLHLDRLSIYLHLISQKDPLRALVRENNCMYDNPDLLEQVVENYVTHELSEKSQKGYIMLTLGRNYCRTAFFLLKYQKMASGGIGQNLLPDFLKKAARFLESSLLSEQYPEFERDERILRFNKRGHVAVPYLFGEFGVRHLLCCIYNELGKGESAGVSSPGASAFGRAIVGHWMSIHSRFKMFDFGSADDPEPAKTLIPRMLALASMCFHPVTKEMLRKAIAACSDGLYARYLAESETLASGS